MAVCITLVSGIISLAVILGLITIREIRELMRNPFVIIGAILLVLNGFISFTC